MTLLTICQDAADELNSVRPATVIGNTMPDVLKLLRYANRVGSDLALRGTWQAMRVAVPFTAVAGETQPGVVPAVSARIIPESFWEVGARKLVSGPVPAAQWQSLTVTNIPGTYRWWTQRGNALLLFPAPTGGEAFRFEYRSRAYCESAAAVAQTRWLADADVGRFSEELFTLGIIALVAEGEGLAFAPAARVDFERRFAREAASDMPRDRILATGDIFKGPRHGTGEPAPDGGVFGRGF